MAGSASVSKSASSAPLDDFFLLALFQHAFHGLLLVDLDAEVVVEDGDQRGRAAAVVVGLAHDVAVLELRVRLHRHGLAVGAAAQQRLRHLVLALRPVLRCMAGHHAGAADQGGDHAQQ
jgi:hypothetical protein